jgi:pimeloyl-ACP methyl ester carboxylesterase
MDLPGFGLTGPAPDGDYSMTRYAIFIAALMDQLGVRRAARSHLNWWTAITN